MVLVVPGQPPAAQCAAGAADDLAVRDRNQEPGRDRLNKQQRPRHVCGVLSKDWERKAAMGVAIVPAQGAIWACLMRPDPEEEDIVIFACCGPCRVPGRT